MKKKTVALSLLACLSLVLTSCGNSAGYSTEDTYVPGQDYQYMYTKPVTGFHSQMTETEDGYYIWANNFLYYADKETMKPVILCNRPDCLHDKETNSNNISQCNAFFPDCDFLAYMNGSLYLDQTAVPNAENEVLGAKDVLKISLDGEKRETLFSISDPEQAAVHRGKLYYSSVVYTTDGQSRNGIACQELKKGAEAETLYIPPEKDWTIYTIQCYGNRLYVIVDKGQSESRIESVTLLDGKTETLGTIHEGTSSYSDISFYQDKLMYHIYKADSDMVYQGSETYLADLDGSNPSLLPNSNIFANVTSDGSYFYYNDFRFSPDYSKPKDKMAIAVHNEKGEELASLPTGESNWTDCFYTGGNDYLFMERGDESSFKLLYGDKSQIENGKLEWKTLLEQENIVTEWANQTES